LAVFIFSPCGKRCGSVAFFELTVKVGLIFVSDTPYDISYRQRRFEKQFSRFFHSLVYDQLFEALAKVLFGKL
jgi:hypothetical protein